jgi:eukaryotic-like serine/threonine-protein kinase
MTIERWQRVKELFAVALETQPSERSAFLDQACADDASLRSELEGLLAAHEEAGTRFLNDPDTTSEVGAGSSGTASTRIGCRIGAYQLVEEIGVGGMGEIYRAIRADDQYRKQVAVKLVRAGEDSMFVIDRFRKERQVLASLDHPNIARLLDGGTTEDGVPYFVMELIEGQPIDEYCDNHRLPITARLILFLQVCSAVQYAHQRLIIHRDLKPSNILVTSDEVPKLLDFGIAKILDPAAASGSAEPTISLFRLLTPRYASPEQIKGEAITTASDVYSLGVVLYELLTGHRPYRIGAGAPHKIAQAVCEFEPERLSTALWRTERCEMTGSLSHITPASVSAVRDGSPDKLCKRLRGDLDNIVLMALRKEPQRRYASVDQFATDIRRHLENLPVSASKGTLQYRTSKFIMRHKAGAAATAIVAITLPVGMVITVHEARIARAERIRAERRLDDIRGLANTLLFDVHDAIQDLPGTTPARKVLVEKSLKYLDGVMTETGSNASVKREVATAYEKMGDVQGNPDVANLGDTAGALQSYRKALTIRQWLGMSLTGENDVLRQVADYEKIGLCLLRMGNFSEALDNLREAVKLNENLTKPAPSAAAQDFLAGAYFYLARGLTESGDYPAALGNYQKAAAIRENQHSDAPAMQSRIQMRLAGTYGYMSGVYSAQGNLEQAIVLQAKARDIMERLLQSDPKNATYQEFASEGYYWVGHYQQKAGHAQSARENFTKALSGFEALATADPADARLQQYLGYCYRGIGMTLATQEKTSAGLASLERALTILQKLRAADGTSTDKLTDVADTQAAIAAAYQTSAESGKAAKATTQVAWMQARTWYEKSLETWKQIKRLGKVSALNSAEPERIQKQITHCDVALARLQASNRR